MIAPATRDTKLMVILEVKSPQMLQLLSAATGEKKMSFQQRPQLRCSTPVAIRFA
jgi:hypothetical protein